MYQNNALNIDACHEHRWTNVQVDVQHVDCQSNLGLVPSYTIFFGLRFPMNNHKTKLKYIAYIIYNIQSYTLTQSPSFHQPAVCPSRTSQE